MKIEELCKKVVNARIEAGYLESNAWTCYSEFYSPLISFCRNRGEEEFCPEIIARYGEYSYERMERGEIKEHRYRAIMTGLRQLVEFNETGKLYWEAQARESKFPVNEYYGDLLEQFTKSEPFHKNTRGDVIWATKRYFSWLMSEGFANMDSVGAMQIQKYLCECHDHLKETSIHNILLYLRKLYRFLKDSGYSDHDYKELPSMKICRESKVLPAAAPEDVNAILNVLDMDTVTGRRDYAIILLGWVMGLRAVDIIRLKLTDIDWKKGEIRVLQRKTSVPAILPLTKDVGEALQEYILNWRPKCDYQEIFLRALPPFRPFKDAVCIGDQYDVYCYRAGIKRMPFDGKGFHSLRRAVGKNMITSGVSVNTVSQVLGHTAMNSAKKYISLDAKNLKECSLDFSGIEVSR